MATDDADNKNGNAESRSSGALLVAGVLALVVGVTGLWFYSAIWSAGKANPETIKETAKKAEESCIVQGGGYDRCKSLVGEHHADCRNSSLVASDDGTETLDRDAYLECMEDVFQTKGIGE